MKDIVKEVWHYAMIGWGLRKSDTEMTQVTTIAACGVITIAIYVFSMLYFTIEEIIK
jgi:hypothetical protein